MVEKLMQAIEAKQNPTVIGLDPFLSMFPEHMIKGQGRDEIAESMLDYFKQIIDAIYDIVPAVKPQSAFFEQYGWQGIKALEELVHYAKSKGLYVIFDGKRNDIGSTCDGYAKAYLTEQFMNADCLTVNGYLGFDGIKPLLDTGRMIFVLAKTSNPSSGELQDLKLESGEPIYEKMAELCEKWGVQAGEQNYGYTNCGIVVGATYPEQIKELRAKAPKTFFLIPGFGAQGGTAADLAHAFDSNGRGAIINNSRGVLYAYKKEEGCSPEDFAGAARRAALKMKQQLGEIL